MTYPPQPPGPGPYGPQDPYGQPQYGQQPPYGQQPQYGPQAPQTPWSGQQPGYPGGPPPPQKKTGLIATLIIVAILVIGGGGVAAYLLLGKDDGGGGGTGGDTSTEGGGGGQDPRATADAYVDVLQTAFNAKIDDVDLAPLQDLACADDYKRLTDELDSAREQQASTTNAPEAPERTTLGITDFKADGDGATFTMTAKRGDKESDPRSMTVAKEGDGLRVCGLYETADDQETPDDGDVTTGSQPEIPNPIPSTSR